MKTLIVAPWGSPKANGKWLWGKARYLSEDGKYSTEARSSIALLTILALERGSQPYVMVIAPDTLYVSAQALPPVKCEYEEIVATVKGWLGECLQEMGEEAGLKPLKEAEVTILPGIGRFKRDRYEYIFQAHLSDFRVLSYLKILRHFIEEDFENVWIDLTHGINYSTALTYRSLIDALESLALYKGLKADEVEEMLRVFNSDPYDRGRGEGQELVLHEVIGVGPRTLELPKTQQLVSLRCKSPLSKLIGMRAEGKEGEGLALRLKEILKDVNEEVRGLMKSILTAVGSVEKGAMLPLKTLIPNLDYLRKAGELIKEVEEAIDKTLMDREVTSIMREGDKVYVLRKAALKSEAIFFVKSLCLTHHLSTMVGTMEEWVSILQLKEFLDKLSIWLPGIVVTLSEQEYGEIARRIVRAVEEGKLEDLERGIKLSELMDTEGQFTKRNFIAHAGLERNVTKVRLKGRLSLMEDEKTLISKAMRMVEVSYTNEGKRLVYDAIIDPDP